MLSPSSFDNVDQELDVPQEDKSLLDEVPTKVDKEKATKLAEEKAAADKKKKEQEKKKSDSSGGGAGGSIGSSQVQPEGERIGKDGRETERVKQKTSLSRSETVR